MITSNSRGGGRGGRRAKRTEARTLRAELSERSRPRKTVIKPAEFRSLNRNTQTYYIIFIIIY
jgi:hypothetical protein